MKLTLRRDLGGFALPALDKAGIDGLTLDKSFVLLTGANGSGKSAVLRGIRASLGLRGERAGTFETPFQPHLNLATTDDLEKLATHQRGAGGATAPHDHVPAVFSLADLGWAGQDTYLFDSRAASQIAGSNSFDDDMAYHISLVAGGGARVSHGQFVAKTWWEAIEWAAGFATLPHAWQKERPSPARAAVREQTLAGRAPSPERWLLIDEPETAIDVEKLTLGLAALIEAAEIGKLRVLCASHSLVFAAGLARHPKVQTVNIGDGPSWLDTQRIVLGIAGDRAKIDSVGRDILTKIRARAA